MKKYNITVNGNAYEVEVEEIGGADFDVTYEGDSGVLLTKAKDNAVTVTNTYKHGTGDLIINKSWPAVMKIGVLINRPFSMCA